MQEKCKKNSGIAPISVSSQIGLQVCKSAEIPETQAVKRSFADGTVHQVIVQTGQIGQGVRKSSISLRWTDEPSEIRSAASIKRQCRQRLLKRLLTREQKASSDGIGELCSDVNRTVNIGGMQSAAQGRHPNCKPGGAGRRWKGGAAERARSDH